MSWEELLADLELRFAADRAAALSGEVDERRAAELAGIALVDRLRPLVGAGMVVAVGLPGHDVVRGAVVALGADWLLLGSGSEEVLVVLERVVWIDGLSARAEQAPRSRAALALHLRHALGVLSRDRSAVHGLLVGGSVVHGTIDAVGSDHVLLALHAVGEPRRASAVSSVRAIPLAAIVAVRQP
jgi:hypothetical protein